MKPLISVIFALTIFGLIIFQAGCASTGLKRSEQAHNTMEAVETDYIKAIEQVNITGVALEELIQPSQSNVKEAFQKYSENVDKMEDLKKRLFERTDEMREKGSEYFDEWRKEGTTYTNPEIRALSEQRRTELNEVFARIPQASEGVRGSIETYMADLTDIRTFLSNDLTPKGIEAISPIAQKAVTDGEALKNSIAPVIDAISEAREEMKPGSANPNP